MGGAGAEAEAAAEVGSGTKVGSGAEVRSMTVFKKDWGAPDPLPESAITGVVELLRTGRLSRSAPGSSTDGATCH